jgi:hypothetical protein
MKNPQVHHLHQAGTSKYDCSLIESCSYTPISYGWIHVIRINCSNPLKHKLIAVKVLKKQCVNLYRRMAKE